MYLRQNAQFYSYEYSEGLLLRDLFIHLLDDFHFIPKNIVIFFLVVDSGF